MVNRIEALDVIHSVDQEVRTAVSAVQDPELPVTIGDLGMVVDLALLPVAGGLSVTVTLRPTFLGCPARFLIEAAVKREASDVSGIVDVTVRWDSRGVWQPSQVTQHGREVLAEHGIVVEVEGESPRCPYCGKDDLQTVSERGVALCRSLAHCPSCHSSVDIMGVARGSVCGSGSTASRLVDLVGAQALAPSSASPEYSIGEGRLS